MTAGFIVGQRFTTKNVIFGNISITVRAGPGATSTPRDDRVFEPSGERNVADNRARAEGFRDRGGRNFNDRRDARRYVVPPFSINFNLFMFPGREIELQYELSSTSAVMGQT